MGRQRVAEIELRGRDGDAEGRQSLGEPGYRYQVNTMHVHMYPCRRSGSSLDAYIFPFRIFKQFRNNRLASGLRFDSPL